MKEQRISRSLIVTGLIIGGVASCGTPPKDSTPVRALPDEPERIVHSPIVVPPTVIEQTVDVCEEILHQIEDQRSTYDAFDVIALEDELRAAEQGLELARHEAHDAAEAARLSTQRHLAAQDHLRALEALQREKADAFRDEILDLSGIRDQGAIEPKEDSWGKRWERFAVLETPPTFLFYEVDEEDANSGERNRLALQETMFTEFPKYWEQTRSTRDSLAEAELALGETLVAKKSSDGKARGKRGEVSALSATWNNAFDAVEQAKRERLTLRELERSYERCRGIDGLASRIARLNARASTYDPRFESAREGHDAATAEIARIAPIGYRRGTHKHVNAADEALRSAFQIFASAANAIDRAEHRLAINDRDGARDFAIAAEEELDRIEAELSRIDVHHERGLFAASEAQQLYLEDDYMTRDRLLYLARTENDHRLLAALREASPIESLETSWEDLGLWTDLPRWLAGDASDLADEHREAIHALHAVLENNFHPCEPHLSGALVLRSVRQSGHAASDAEAMLFLAEACSLLERIARL